MILAAGRGERLRPLTDATPKCLLEVGGRPLIEHHLLALQRAGIRTVVINHAHLGEQIVDRLGNGDAYGLRIVHSPEPPVALDTGGGIAQALPLLGSGPFIVVNADLWSDFDFSSLPAEPDGLGHLVLVENPAHNAAGDFTLRGNLVGLVSEHTLTYSGIAVLRARLFEECREARFPLAPLLRHAASQGLLTGQRHAGQWLDVGTPERLAQARALAASA